MRGLFEGGPYMRKHGKHLEEGSVISILWSRADQVLVSHQLHRHFVTMLEGILGTLLVQFPHICQQIYFKLDQIFRLGHSISE